MQISVLKFQSGKYPDQLRQIASPPKQLYYLGELPQGSYVAIVGSRKPTDYGRQVTYQLAASLARAGFVVVSGLALGIDAIAHQATIEAGGKTVAVLGNGLPEIYPSTNRNLARKILTSGGAIVTEYETGVSPQKFTFPARNRIIAGLAEVVIIPEADASSGSLITANFAINEGRTVMAVPGNITNIRSAGPNNLIRNGAVPIVDVNDVLAFFNMKSPEASRPVKADSAEEAQILELLGQGFNSTDQLIEQTGLSAARFANVITLMEITGKVRNLGAGNWVSR